MWAEGLLGAVAGAGKGLSENAHQRFQQERDEAEALRRENLSRFQHGLNKEMADHQDTLIRGRDDIAHDRKGIGFDETGRPITGAQEHEGLIYGAQPGRESRERPQRATIMVDGVATEVLAHDDGSYEAIGPAVGKDADGKGGKGSAASPEQVRLAYGEVRQILGSAKDPNKPTPAEVSRIQAVLRPVDQEASTEEVSKGMLWWKSKSEEITGFGPLGEESEEAPPAAPPANSAASPPAKPPGDPLGDAIGRATEEQKVGRAAAEATGLIESGMRADRTPGPSPGERAVQGVRQGLEKIVPSREAMADRQQQGQERRAGWQQQEQARQARELVRRLEIKAQREGLSPTEEQQLAEARTLIGNEA